MENEIVLNDWNPSGETLRRWAFDTTLVLSDQDEDLILSSQEYFPVLISLADDPRCPKAEYILRCLDHCLMFHVLRGSDAHLAEVREAIQVASHARQPNIRAWVGLQQRRLQYREGIGPVSRERALAMGAELLNGICRVGQISLVGDDSVSWRVQHSLPPCHLHKEQLSISKTTGQFVHSG